jgi:hypothetical protein
LDTLTAEARMFRTYVDPQWIPESENGSRSWRGFVAGTLPYTEGSRNEKAATAAPEGTSISPDAPLAYHLAVTFVGAPARPLAPRMSSHTYVSHKTSYDSKPWEDGICAV